MGFFRFDWIDDFVVRLTGVQCAVTVRSIDKCNVPRLKGGDTWHVRFVRTGGGQLSVRSTHVDDNGDGSYRVGLLLPEAGEWDVQAALNTGAYRSMGSVWLE